MKVRFKADSRRKAVGRFKLGPKTFNIDKFYQSRRRRSSRKQRRR